MGEAAQQLLGAAGERALCDKDQCCRAAEPPQSQALVTCAGPARHGQGSSVSCWDRALSRRAEPGSGQPVLPAGCPTSPNPPSSLPRHGQHSCHPQPQPGLWFRSLSQDMPRVALVQAAGTQHRDPITHSGPTGPPVPHPTPKTLLSGRDTCAAGADAALPRKGTRELLCTGGA